MMPERQLSDESTPQKMDREIGDGGNESTLKNGSDVAEDSSVRSSCKIDRYGFIETDTTNLSTMTVPEAMLKKRIHKENDRSKKWLRMLHKDGSSKLKERARKGIPDAVRGASWLWIMQQYVSEYGEIKKRYPDPSSILTRHGSESTLDARTTDEIERDIDRTFPKHTMFEADGGLGQNALRRILQNYAALDTEVGYCQGMGFIAALFLTYLVEEDAFYCFHSALSRASSPLRLMYLPKMSETQKVLHVFEQLGAQHLGSLWTHMSSEGIHPTMYATEWFMTMFCRGFSFDLVTRVWDIYLAEGNFKIVYRVSLAILKSFEKEFMARSFEKMMALLKELPRLIDANALIELTWKIPLKTAHITHHEAEYAKSLSGSCSTDKKKVKG